MNLRDKIRPVLKTLQRNIGYYEVFGIFKMLEIFLLLALYIMGVSQTWYSGDENLKELKLSFGMCLVVYSVFVILSTSMTMFKLMNHAIFGQFQFQVTTLVIALETFYIWCEELYPFSYPSAVFYYIILVLYITINVENCLFTYKLKPPLQTPLSKRGRRIMEEIGLEEALLNAAQLSSIQNEEETSEADVTKTMFVTTAEVEPRLKDVNKESLTNLFGPDGLSSDPSEGEASMDEFRVKICALSESLRNICSQLEKSTLKYRSSESLKDSSESKLGSKTKTSAPESISTKTSKSADEKLEPSCTPPMAEGTSCDKADSDSAKEDKELDNAKEDTEQICVAGQQQETGVSDTIL